MQLKKKHSLEIESLTKDKESWLLKQKLANEEEIKKIKAEMNQLMEDKVITDIYFNF